ncbi:hypothetical protein EDC01DRAFT_635920 [Geopyxis carbonaria]|nr:hypothetical protein EDC01DRAFT_635920 [Geopyxis carbonaria]
MQAERTVITKSASDGNLPLPQNDVEIALSDVTSDTAHQSSDLNKEVAALSNKLISAINHQTKLDDSLSATRHELEISKARIRQLEAVATEHADMMAKGLLVEKKEFETETRQLMTRLQEESLHRGQAEKDKRNIEQELENLTTALFDEANKMVSAARKERDTVDRKNEQLRVQLGDTETLLASHQEQLAQLKAVMQQMTMEREEGGSKMSSPSTPALFSKGGKDSMGKIFEALHLTPSSTNIEDTPVCPPTSLTNLVHPVLRHDIAAYQDFCEVLSTSKHTQSSAVTRLSGGSFSSIQVMGITMPSPGQSPTMGGSIFGGKRKLPTNHSPSSSGNDGSLVVQALKETRFYKRVLVEDIEPTLRLECAPGLSWLARRNVQAAITDGTLVIDPMPTSPRVNMFGCALCGESRADEEHARTHRMRISDNQTAQRYPLCGYCVSRLRSVCDFLAFLKTLKEGLWKCESEGDQKHAWEESVKLRERMFWSRIGGGVVPAFIIRESRRNSIVRPSSDVHHQPHATPPRTPVSVPEGESKLDIPKRRSKPIDPFLTLDRQLEPNMCSQMSLLNISEAMSPRLPDVKTNNTVPTEWPSSDDANNDGFYKSTDLKETETQITCSIDASIPLESVNISTSGHAITSGSTLETVPAIKNPLHTHSVTLTEIEELAQSQAPVSSVSGQP